MDQPLRPCEAAEGGFWMGAKNGFAPLQLGEGRRRPVGRNAPECAIFIEHHAAEVGLAYARRVLQHGLEYGLELARRTRDDAQHLRGRRLLLQRLGQFTSAGLHLVEQPHVLNRDHRLIGEGLDKRDLLVIERLAAPRRAVAIAPMTLSSRIMGAKMTALNPISRAARCVTSGAAGLPSTGANWRTCFDNIARPPPEVPSSGRGNCWVSLFNSSSSAAAAR